MSGKWLLSPLRRRMTATPPQQTGARTVHDGMPAGWPRRLAVMTITIGLSMSVLANSMTNLALPYIAHDLGITAESSIWIVNASQIALMVDPAADRGAGRHRRLSPRLSRRAGAVLPRLARLRAGAVAALADRSAHAARGWAARR